eukprot:TRINITY_DN42756_c0_g1_i1.p1 TRINITY_DN42756_c0_g1~~TRINITY_DN42756_c0_g1_i1.p1  ORF type:complete len:190 (+),score=35.09 TRINITY_DN42756_c0_g1_i1:129-698(+)
MVANIVILLFTMFLQFLQVASVRLGSNDTDAAAMGKTAAESSAGSLASSLLEPNSVGRGDQCDKEQCKKACERAGFGSFALFDAVNDVYCYKGAAVLMACAGIQKSNFNWHLEALCSASSGKGAEILKTLIQDADNEPQPVSMDLNAAEDTEDPAKKGKLIGYYRKFGFELSGMVNLANYMKRPAQKKS